MKIAIATTFAAAMLAASSLAFAADNNGGKNNGNDQDKTTTGSVNANEPGASEVEKEKCREGVSGGASCDEMGIQK